MFGVLSPAVFRAFLWDMRCGWSPLVILGEDLFGVGFEEESHLELMFYFDVS